MIALFYFFVIVGSAGVTFIAYRLKVKDLILYPIVSMILTPVLGLFILYYNARKEKIEFNLNEIFNFKDYPLDFDSVDSTNNESSNTKRVLINPGYIIQVLESLKILISSKNLDTMNSRYEFLLERLVGLKEIEGDINYPKLCSLGIDQYRAMYYAENLPDKFFNAVYKPSALNNELPAIFDVSLLRACNEYSQIQLQEIEGLKTNKAKINRLIKVKEFVNQAISISKNGLSVNNDELKNILNKIDSLYHTFSDKKSIE
jgi:hypothetical protein